MLNLLRALGLTLALLLPTEVFAATCFWIGGTGSWSTANTASWASTSGGTTGTCAATGSIPKQAADTATFDNLSGGGTVTVDTTMNGTTLTQINMGAFTGTLDFSANNPSMTITTAFNANGAGARVLNLGSGTFTLSGTGTAWDASGATFTLNAGTSTLLFNGSLIAGTQSRVLQLGTSKTYATISITNPGNNYENTQISGTTGATIGTLNLTAPLHLQFATSLTYTITNAFAFAGSSSSNMILLGASSSASPSISTATGSPLCNWCAIGGITFTGGASFSATNSVDLRGNSGITITGPTGGGGGRIIGG